MPQWSIRLVRTGLLYLAAGFLFGALLLVQKAGWNITGGLALLPLHTECVLIGWFVQTTMGVAYWILPRYPTHPERGPDWHMAGAFVLINVGILTTAAGLAWSPATAVPLAGRLAQSGAILLFGLHAWPRVRPFLAPGPSRP